jgi:hypothetical protein
VGVEVVAIDTGPGIADVAAALRDHHSTGGTLGLGLPAVRRMSDEMSVDTAPGVGTTVTARRWATRGEGASNPPQQRAPVEPPVLLVDHGSWVRPAAGHVAGGDLVWIRSGPTHLNVVVIDVLGHGPNAARVAAALSDRLDAAPEIEPGKMLGRLSGSELGCAAAALTVELASGGARFDGIGNVAGVVVARDGSTIDFPSRPGILGSPGVRPLTTHFTLTPGQVVLLASDGVTDLHTAACAPERFNTDPSAFARLVVERYGKSFDDACCAVVRAREGRWG